MSRLKQATLERAQFAHSEVSKIYQERYAGEFKAYVKKLPMLIRTNGLAAAYAFAWSKSETDKPDNKKSERANAWIKIAGITRKWLTQKTAIINSDSTEAMYQDMLKLSVQDYRWCIHEIFALFTWLKRYADAMIEKEESDES